MRFDTLSSRIFLTFGGLLALLLVGAAIAGEVMIRAFHREDVEARLTAVAEALRPAVLDGLHAGEGGRQTLVMRVKEVGAAARLRITVVGPDGTVLADSESALPLANHGDRPEVRAAIVGGHGTDARLSATTGKETFYVADRIDEPGGNLAGVVRTATELAAMDRSLATWRKSLLLAAGVAAVGGLAASWLLARWLSGPLVHIERAARTLEEGGEVPAIVEQHAGPRETKRLAHALRHASEELSRRVDAAWRARQELEAVLSSMSEGVIAFDAEERVVLMNQAAARALDLAAPLGEREPLWRHARFPDLERELRAVLAGGTTASSSSSLELANGRTLAFSIAPLRADPTSAGAPVTGAVALLSDVTELRALEKVRIDFVANVSHELRTPLAAVLGALETLDDEGLDAEGRERFMDIARRNATRLQAIVNDLLDLSAIEAEGGRMATEPIPVLAPLRTAAAALAGAAQQKHIRIDLPPRDRRGAVVRGNAQRLEQVFTNLLENAIKYTPEKGRIQVSEQESDDQVTVEIRDTGIGIPKSSLPRIFERFYRVDRSRSREQGGTGLGLAIVKHAVRAHGGTVEVQSEEGVGSTFTVRLPKRDARSRPGAEET